MNARYEGNPLTVGDKPTYQAIGILTKTNEYHDIALAHAMCVNYLQGQGHTCGNIGNVYMNVFIITYIDFAYALHACWYTSCLS